MYKIKNFFLKDDSILETDHEEPTENNKNSDAEKNKTDDAVSLSIDLSESQHPFSRKKFKVCLNLIYFIIFYQLIMSIYIKLNSLTGIF